MSCPEFSCAPSAVGSFPHLEPEPLIDQIFSRLPDLPIWPQMPLRSWLESMYVQYSEGLPGAVIDTAAQRIHFRRDDGLQNELEAFYQALVEEDVDRFAISRDYALGLHMFLERLRELGTERPRWIKGQVTGPFSFSMIVTDESKRSMAYTPELLEVAVQGMAMKARWLARELRKLAGGAIVVLDEPYLSAFGSAFVNASREEVTAAIDTAVAAVHAEAALAGLHCCGNTDWSLVLGTGVDVVSFDAYEFFQGMSLYPAELSAFLARGGILSWGIVPTSSAIERTTAAGLLAAFDERIGQLAARGIDRAALYRQALVTPACGMGTQDVRTADRVMEILVELSARLRDGGHAG